MTRVLLQRPWLEMNLGEPMQVLSWSLNRPGLVTAQRIVWREVRNADLPPELDVNAWFDDELAAHDASDAVGFLTSRDVSKYKTETKEVEGVRCSVLATVGLSNAESVGHRFDRSGKDWGTINIACQVDQTVSEAALLELMSIVVQARTAAVMEVSHRLPTGIATGTGTDCVAVAAPPGDIPFAGLHTAIGEAAGAATYSAVLSGAREWMDKVRKKETWEE